MSPTVSLEYLQLFLMILRFLPKQHKTRQHIMPKRESAAEAALDQQTPPGQPSPAMDPDAIPPGQPTPVVTAVSQEAEDLRAALVADLLRVEQEALLNEVAETLAYLNLELLSTSEAVTHIVAVVDDFRRRCAQILG